VSFTVAIDGPAASGKGTIARAVARHFGMGHLDTGLLYRAVGHRMLGGEDPVAAALALSPADLEGEALRGAAAAEAASQVAAIPEVRAALVDFQRAFAARAGGAVLDGRDIGTVICPDAAVKLFVTATDEVRADRRWAELTQRGEAVTRAEVLDDIRRRDLRDSTRTDAPLRAAPDATILDTTALSVDEAVARAIGLVAARQPG
jgi:cytidylate kinase